MDDFGGIFQSAWGVVLLVLFFGGSIFIHELGHLLAARWRGLKVERFSIGLGPRLFGWKGKDGVDYRISLLPLGGYVALPQLADMSGIEGKTESDAEKLPPISYADKMIVSVAGAVFNILFALGLSLIIWIFGYPVPEYSQTTTIGYVPQQIVTAEGATVESPAWKAGIRPGDTILKVDGVSVDAWRPITELIITGSGRTEDDRRQITMTLERDGEVRTVQMEPVIRVANTGTGEGIRAVGIMPRMNLQIGEVSKGSPAAAAGLQKDDVILAADGQPLYYVTTLNDYIQEQGSQPINLRIQRDGQTLETTVTPRNVPTTKTLATLSFTKSADEPPQIIEFDPVFEQGAADPSDPAATATLRVFRSPREVRKAARIIPGQTVEAINGQAVRSVNEFVSVFNDPENNPKIVTLRNRNGSNEVVVMPAGAQAAVIPPIEEARIGVGFAVANKFINPPPLEQFERHLGTLTRVLGGIVHPKSDISPLNLSGPVGIARIYWTFTREGILLVIWFTIFLNINLAVINLLPIPVLDGGHMVYATLAKLRGRPLPTTFVAATQSVFILIIFGFFIYLVFADVLRWQGDADAISQIEQESSLQLDNPFKPGQKAEETTAE